MLSLLLLTALTQPTYAAAADHHPRLEVLTNRWERGAPVLDLRRRATVWAFPIDVEPHGDVGVTPAWHLEVEVGGAWIRFEWPNLLYGVAVHRRGSLSRAMHDLLSRYPLLGVRSDGPLAERWAWVEGRTPAPHGWVLKGSPTGAGLTRVRLRLVAPASDGSTQVTPPVELWVLR